MNTSGRVSNFRNVTPVAIGQSGVPLETWSTLSEDQRTENVFNRATKVLIVLGEKYLLETSDYRFGVRRKIQLGDSTMEYFENNTDHGIPPQRIELFLAPRVLNIYRVSRRLNRSAFKCQRRLNSIANVPS